MAIEMRREAWNHTASILAEIHNCLCTNARSVASFHPFMQGGGGRPGSRDAGEVSFADFVNEVRARGNE